MSSPRRERAVQPSLLLPPITRLTAPDASGALPEFVARTQSWGRHAVPLPVAVTCAFWLTAFLSGAVGGWLIAVLTGNAPCGGVVCTIVTVGNHPRLLLILAAFCVGSLLGLAPFTRGLTRAGGPELALMIVAAMAGAGALLGVVAAAVLTVATVFLGVAALVALLDRD